MAVKKFSTDSSIKNSFKLSRGATSVAKPEAPTIGAVAAGATPSTQVTVAYTAATLGAAASTFTATSTPSSLTGTGSSPITVSGLTASTSYTFTVKASNANGDSPASAASSSITTSVDPVAYQSIATVTLSSNATEIEFTSIPATFKHLQIRGIARNNRATTNNNTHLQVGNGSIDTGANYTYHTIRGNGSTVTVDGLGSQVKTDYHVTPAANANANVFGAQVWDILDYANTSKYKTMRVLSGADNNSDGIIEFTSSVWQSTSAITNLKFTLSSTPSFVQYTQFALYGIKGA